jgi:hypothetical protein
MYTVHVQLAACLPQCQAVVASSLPVGEHNADFNTSRIMQDVALLQGHAFVW